MEDSYGRLHMNIDVREIKQVVNILHIHPKLHMWDPNSAKVNRKSGRVNITGQT